MSDESKPPESVEEPSSSETKPEKPSADKSPFEDPVTRTKILIQYVRLKQKRAQAELEEKTALKQKKLDARATLQNALEDLKECEEEIERTESRKRELKQQHHETTTTLKAVLHKESEQKRRREAEDQRRRDEQLELQRRQQAQQLEATAAALMQHQTLNQLFTQQLLAQQRAHATPSPVAALAASHRASPYSMLPQQFAQPTIPQQRSQLSQLAAQSAAPVMPLMDPHNLLYATLMQSVLNSLARPGGFPAMPPAPNNEPKNLPR